MTPDPLDRLVPIGDGQTPLGADDLDGLIPAYISTRGELFEAEHRSIARALVGERPTIQALLDDVYLRDLHRRMFAEVWDWAGHYRRTETNVGVAPEAIAGSVRDIVEDVRVWIDQSTYGRDEIAVRFHHRLVSVHPFVNGNGRHSRIAADLLVIELGQPRFTWGSNLEVSTDELRNSYLSALRAADSGDIEPLVTFARTRPTTSVEVPKRSAVRFRNVGDSESERRCQPVPSHQTVRDVPRRRTPCHSGEIRSSDG